MKVALLLLIHFLSASGLPAKSNDFTVAFMADPQPWRINSLNADPNGDRRVRQIWLENNTRIAQAINTNHRDVAFGIINGDMTEFGRKQQRKDFYDIYYNTLNFPFYIGLGNHDYANNVGHCTAFGPLFPSLEDPCSDFCAHTAVRDMQNNIEIMAPVLTNFNSDPYSLAYSWDHGDIHFVQLQNYPTYYVTLTSCVLWTQYYDDVRPSLDWLEADLDSASHRTNLKATILNFHDPSDHFFEVTTDEQRRQFKDILTRYKVTAVFAGHWHRQFVITVHEYYGDVPVFVTDALFKGGYYLVTFKENRFSIDSYNTGMLDQKLDDVMYK